MTMSLTEMLDDLHATPAMADREMRTRFAWYFDMPPADRNALRAFVLDGNCPDDEDPDRVCLSVICSEITAPHYLTLEKCQEIERQWGGLAAGHLTTVQSRFEAATAGWADLDPDDPKGMYVPEYYTPAERWHAVRRSVPEPIEACRVSPNGETIGVLALVDDHPVFPPYHVVYWRASGRRYAERDGAV
jgi:hypothetical protein